MSVMTAQHSWVKHVITPVQVLVGDDGNPVLLVDPDQQTLSEEEAAYGCQNCGLSMVEGFGEACEIDPTNIL